MDAVCIVLVPVVALPLFGRYGSEAMEFRAAPSKMLE